MAIKEAIILAGGPESNFRDTFWGLPKCMALVAGRPFITYVIDYCLYSGINRIVLALGHKADFFIHYLNEKYETLDKYYSVEETPLGTGGALCLALQYCNTDDVLVLHGDTMFHYDIDELYAQHHNTNADCTLSLKPVLDIDQNGSVELDEDNRIKYFHEKKYIENGLINAGAYIVNIKSFLKVFNPEYKKQFSFENDYLDKFVSDYRFFGNIQDRYYVDIGIPSDFEKAQIDFEIKPIRINASSALFLDRDGVLNEELKGDYVKNPDELHILDGVPKALQIFSKYFSKIFIVTNQRGVGKGLMTEQDLLSVNEKLIALINEKVNYIDKIYYCISVDDQHPNRKPRPGMAYEALKDFPEISLENSIMVGNNISDMEFGRNASMLTVFLSTTNGPCFLPQPLIDYQFDSLLEFAEYLQAIIKLK